MWFAASHYLYSVLFIAGAFLCLYLGFRLVRARTKAADAASSFSGKWGDKEFTIGAGSLAASCLAVSLFWVGAAVWTRPTLSYQQNPDGESISVSAVFEHPRFRELETAIRNSEVREQASAAASVPVAVELPVDLPPLPPMDGPHDQGIRVPRKQGSGLLGGSAAIGDAKKSDRETEIACSNGADGMPCSSPAPDAR